MIKKLPSVIKELFFLIASYGICVEIIVLIVTKDWLFYSIGLIVGLILAMGMCVHMYISIEEALDRGESGAQKHVSKMYAFRVGVIFIVAGIMFYFKIGSVVSLFIGMMGLKVSAYLQPFTHKFFQKYIGKGR